MKISILIPIVASIVFVPILADAHQSGCHRWHSCPSDSGSYTCGDTGYCSGCPDNQYCKADQYSPDIKSGYTGQSLNSAVLENGFGIIDSRFCSVSEFSSEEWAVKFGC